MKTQALSFCFLFPILGLAQPFDSLLVTHQVDSLIQASRDFTDQGEFEKALALNETAEQLALETLGKESAAYGSVCFNYGRLMFAEKNYPEAEKWHLKSKTIRGKVLGNRHPDYGASLHNLAGSLFIQGELKKAEPLLLELSALWKEQLGSEHPQYAQCLNNLGLLYYQLSNYEAAEPLLLETLNIQEKTIGKEHPHYFKSLNNLGVLYKTMGNFERAKLFHLKALDSRKKVLGKDHPEYAQSLGNLGTLYKAMGDYKEAEPLLLEALSIKEELLGKEHPEYANSLSNLGVFYMEVGNYKKAETFYLKYKAIFEKVLGKDRFDYCGCLINLGNLYLEKRDYEKAEPLFLEALDIFENRLKNREHRYYMNCLGSLGLLYHDLGEFEKAEFFYLKSKNIRKSFLGEDHPVYAHSLNNLGGLYWEVGNYEKAESFYLEAKAIKEKSMGKKNSDYLSTLNNLAVLYWSQNQYETSKRFFFESSKIEKSIIIDASRHFSERELSYYIQTFASNNVRILSYLTIDTGLVGVAYDNTLFYKGFLLNTARQVNHLAQTDSISSEAYHRLKSYHRLLAQEYAKPIAERQNVPELEEEANRVEKELVRTVTGFGAAIRQVDWKEVQGNLKPGEAAVEFVHYQFHNPKLTDSILYAALVLRPGDEHPQFLPLFEERALKKATEQPAGNQQTYLAQLYTRGFEKKKASNLQGLYELIWEPLDSLLAGVKTVYYSPSGLLHRISQEAIPIDSTMRLVDKYQLRLLNSTRSLVVADEAASLKNDALLFGGIEYDKPSAESHLDSTIDDQSGLTFIDMTRELRGGSWKFLPGTKEETQAIAGLLASKEFGLSLKQGRAATEEAFKKIGQESPSPRILHIATHGFFFPDPIDTLQQDILGVREPVFKLSDDPMIRSGLILAGANHAWQGHAPAEGEEDGILTAYEISQLNLRHTELVVLSACETGLGDIEGNEGVYGLQRAFKIAGAKYLIMSLWQVPDLETQEFMATFYQEWLGGKTIHQAFRDTQQRMRELNEGPYYWAAFVLIE